MKKLIEEVESKLAYIREKYCADIEILGIDMSEKTGDLLTLSAGGSLTFKGGKHFFLGYPVLFNNNCEDNQLIFRCTNSGFIVEITKYMVNSNVLDVEIKNSSDFGEWREVADKPLLPSRPSVDNRETKITDELVWSEHGFIPRPVVQTDYNRASGRTFRTCLDVLKTASESNNGNVTFLVTRDGNEQRTLWVALLNLLSGYFDDNEFSCDRRERQFTLHGHRFIRVITKKQTQNVDMFRGRQSKIIYEHTVNPGLTGD